eukprot:GFUD01038496.1.p1 GENE.GFUD01038496.1~~GFUD01038496.1.p1  ORF type:complete len:125 (-),score=23.17 GFUD01038496.1:53-427(-)
MTIIDKSDIPELDLELNHMTKKTSVIPMALIPRNSKGKTSSKKTKASLAQQRKDLNQLRKEVTIKRLPVSSAINDLVSFVSDQSSQDFLLSGHEGKKSNPYRDKPPPTVLCLPFSRNRRRSCTM